MGMEKGGTGHVSSNQATFRLGLGGCLLCLALGVPGLAVADDLTTPPPPRWDSGVYTATWVYLNDAGRACQQRLGRPPPPRRMVACYLPATDEILISRDCDPAGGPIGPVCKALRRHEEAHARGGAHDQFGNWFPGPWTLARRD